MTFEERLAELGVDLSDLPKEYDDSHVRKYIAEILNFFATKAGDSLKMNYPLYLVDIIDRMETRLVNVTGERDYFLQFIQKNSTWIGSYPCDICKASSNEEKCWRNCEEGLNNQVTESFEFGVPDDWRVDDARP